MQEFLTGAEVLGAAWSAIPIRACRALPILEVDYSRLDERLPKILGYESKWEPDSPYWTQIKYREATLADQKQQQLIDSSSRLFERLGLPRLRPLRLPRRCQGRDQAARGQPEPRLVLGRQDEHHGRLPGHALLRSCLSQILLAAVERLGIVAEPLHAQVPGNGHGQSVAAE